MNFTETKNKETYRYEWIPGYENMYKISEYGDVVSFVRKTPKFLKRFPVGKGYIAVTLKLAKGETKRLRHKIVANLVLQAFGPPKPSPLHKTHYKDGNVQNIHISNLEWRSKEEIMRETINRIKGSMKRKDKTTIIIVIPGRNEASRLFSHQIFPVDTGVPFNKGYLTFTDKGFEEWRNKNKLKL